MAEYIRHLAHIAFVGALFAFPVCLFLAAWALECLRQYDGFIPESPSGAGASRHAGHRGGV